MAITEKSAFLMFRYSWRRLFYSSFVVLLKSILPYIVVIGISNWSIAGYVSTIIIIHALFCYVALKLRSPATVSLAFPVSTIFLIYSWWRSAFLTFTRNGIHRRGRFYSLKELRSKMVK